MPDFAALKAMARRTVHDTFAVRCVYTAPGSATPVELRARLHSKLAVGGDIGGGYATILEGVSRAVFNREQLALVPVVLTRNGSVVFPDYVISGQPLTYILENRDPIEGPINERWTLGAP